ncbi:VIT-domain-containing protein [Rhizodiscina lignyota]|uniref:VIT-domain-containing protein n=1 Tax=Rhizodiscina lignyota TaxID=1504668 RepID=A0A9P4M388_9PEZI|nr:VIT-domain-containing protein [Rhizodiscina lignyota]
MDHVCGFHYLLPASVQFGQPRRFYLPQVQLKAHTTILSSTSRTTLEQIFINPSSAKGIKEVRYTFPLYDGVSVVGFSCRIDGRTIKGVVKEKERARADFKEAVERGETAGLLEQLPDASDVFTTTVGNVPPGASIIVEITYLGELKHDAEVDGLRFTIPTAISPRYGSLPGELCGGSATTAQGRGGMQITVDAMLENGSFIREMRSPSHPIAVTMGNISTAKDDDPAMNKASATLSLGSAELDKDFVLQVVAKDTATPRAILETHPTIAHQRALMATLVPKFSLPPARPEIVFICDRSGSMDTGKIRTLVSALKVFLKSLPVGVKFNICSFGSHHDFLWPKSKSYSQSALDEAIKHVESFSSNYGGTEMFAPIKDTLERRYKDMELEVFLVTDGQIWHQQELFQYLNQEIGGTGAPIRVFTLGIGDGVSHSLIEGIARAGHGFSQAVGESERLDTKVVRMLKAALTPHVKDYTLEVKYGAEANTGSDDFEVIEKVADSLRIHLNFSEKATEKEKTIKPMSLFDTSADADDSSTTKPSTDGQDRYAHLPTIATPKLLQAPNVIPPLFPFTRATVYLLLSPETNPQTPTSVMLRGTCPSANGDIPLELEIPVQVLDKPGETIHQLAAKKAVGELEEGRGWIFSAKDETTGKLPKDVREGRFGDMVEREAVRLGVQFQIGGKWCSFVALEENDKENTAMKDSEEYAFLDEETLGVEMSETRPQYPTLDTLMMSRSSPAPKKKKMMNLARKSAPSAVNFNSASGTPIMFDRLRPSAAIPPPPQLHTQNPLDALIALQTFEGSWSWSGELFRVLALRDTNTRAEETRYKNAVATALAVAYFEQKLVGEKEAWELVVEKARGWLEEKVGKEGMDTLMKAVEEAL